MANLSNLNNKFIVTDGGNALINATANLTTYGGLTIDNISNPSIAMKTSSASGWIYTQYITSSGTNNFSMGVNQSVPYWGVGAGAGMSGSNMDLVVNSSGNVGIGTFSPNQEGFGAANRVLSVKASGNGGVGSIELIGLGNSDNDELGYVNFMSQAATNSAAAIVGLRHTSDTSGKLSFRTAGNERMRITETGEIRTTNRLAFKETYFGYSSGYKVVQYGASVAASGISLGYNPIGNPSGSFSGNEILIPNNIRVLAPAASNNGYYGLMMLNSSNKVLLGSSNYLMENNYIMALDTATKNVGIDTDSPMTGTNNLGLQIQTGPEASLFLGNPQGGQGAVFQTSDNRHRAIIGANVYDDPSGSWNVFTSGKGIAGVSFLADTGNWGTGIDFWCGDTDSIIPRMTIASSGNVGIGISTPYSKLQVNSAVDTFAGHFGQGQNNTNGNYGGISLGYSENANASYRKVAIVAQATGDGAARQNLLFLVDGAADGNSAGIADNKMILNYDGAIKIGNGSNIAINTNGQHYHAPGPSGLSMRQYEYYVDIPNGSTIDLFKNSSAYSDIQMTKISIVMYHSSRTYFAGMGTVGGYALALTGAGIGQANGGLTASVVSTGIRKLQIANNSGYQATARIFIEIMADSGVIVLNGSISAPY